MAYDTHLCRRSTTFILNSGGISAGAAPPARTCDDAWVGSPIRGGSGDMTPGSAAYGHPELAAPVYTYRSRSSARSQAAVLSDICHTLTRISE